MTALAALAHVVPALSLGTAGLALLRSRARISGVLLLVTAMGLLASAAASLAERPTWVMVLIVADLAIVVSALFAYPVPGACHWVDYCLWVVAVAGGLMAVGFVVVNPTATRTLALILAFTPVVHGWRVLDGGEEEDRTAMLWLGGAGLVIAVAVTVIIITGPESWTLAVGVLPATVLGPAMLIGVRRPDLTDPHTLVVSTVVVIVLALTYLSAFLGSLSLLEAAGIHDVPPIVIGVLGLALAVGFHPLRVVLRGLIDELLFGNRPDPLVAAVTVADRIGDDPLHTLRAVREALVLPYASICMDGVDVATTGTAVTELVRLPLATSDEVVGEVAVALRPGQLALSTEDQQVLRIVGALLTQNLRARALAVQVSESRASAIATIEDERRRLRRDLHDGLGPTLSGIAHAAAAVHNSIPTDPATAQELLDDLRTDAAAAVGEIRRLVYDMRPPALDELGLVEALREQLSSVRTPNGRAVQLSVQSGKLPALPAAIEVAAYRIATEAVTNAARHSGSDRAWLRLEQDSGHLVVMVRDAGSSARAWVPGVGVVSMRERAAEVEGTIQFNLSAGGSTVRARLPLGDGMPGRS